MLEMKVSNSIFTNNNKMNNLIGKTLLVMDNTALGASAVIRAKELGVRTIVANFYPFEKSASKQVADEHIEINISDIDAMVQLIHEKSVDGVFVGWTDSHLPFYADICEKAGLPCCATKEQFGILSNDKHKFKEACLKYGVPCAEEFKLDINFKQEDLDRIKYPVMVKPADGSGGRGIKRCNNEEELKAHYTHLYEQSESKNIICERFVESDKEIFLNYTIQNGYCSLSAAYMSYKDRTTTLHVYPSSYIKQYQETVEPAVKRMFEGLGLKNAVLSLQGFVENDSFCFHETGLRMGGGQSYVFTKELNRASALDLMIEFSLTGAMTLADLKVTDNPYFTQFAVNYYIKLTSGTIASIEGYDIVKGMPQVLQISTFKKVGDSIPNTTATDAVIYRMHVMDKTIDALAKTLATISETLKIKSTDGINMQAIPLTYDKALNVIKKS